MTTFWDKEKSLASSEPYELHLFYTGEASFTTIKEDFRSFTQQGFDSYLIVDENTITVNGIDPRYTFAADRWLYKDMSLNYFNSDFTHRIKVNISNIVPAAHTPESILYFWALTKAAGAGDLYQYRATNADFWGLFVYGPNSNFKIYLNKSENGSNDSDISIDLSYNTNYFITISRDDDGGVNGTGRYTCYICTGNYYELNGASLIDTLQLDAGVGEQNDFRYIWSLSTYKASVWGGREVYGSIKDLNLGELIEDWSSVSYYAYADCPRDIVYNDVNYKACYIKGEKIEQGSTLAKSRTQVRCNWNLPFAWQYTTRPPDSVVHYKRYQGQGENIQLIFVGDVLGIQFLQSSRQGERHAEITIESPRASLGRLGLITRYSRLCAVELYSTQCGVNRSDYAEEGTLTGVSDNVLTSTTFGGQADGYWLGGNIIINSRYYKIIEHSGNDVTVVPFPYDIAVGDSFDAAPGCNHTTSICNSKFGNLANYKGQPNIPINSPFGELFVSDSGSGGSSFWSEWSKIL